jgi:hypothetical protein
MRKYLSNLFIRFAAGLIAVGSAQLAVNAQVSVQVPSNVVETGSNAWHYLIMEGESYVSKMADPAVGFTKVFGNEDITAFYGKPILGTNTSASKRGALFTQTAFSQWADKATYQVVFNTPGIYYTYMRFTMYENGGATNSYLNEDSFFLPPDFNKDPQWDWPITNSPSGRTGGYCEGGLGQSGFLWIIEPGTGGLRTNHSGNDGTDQSGYWEGNFHWNQLISSQFLNPLDTGEPNYPFHYEVTPAMVGVPQSFTIGYREGGVTIDFILFSTHTNLMDAYSETQLDKLLVNKVTVQDPGNVVGTGPDAWSYLVLEGESFHSRSNLDASVGFTSVAAGSTNTDFYGNPILGMNTSASKRGALFTQTAFSQWADKVSYQMVFNRPGTYYTYMRFTMFENGGSTNSYLNEDSFFLPPDFNKDPQWDWPITNSPSGRTGGYCEGGLGQSGFLWIIEPGTGGLRTNHSGNDGTDQTGFWEGKFHWNQLISSQFLNPADTGEPSNPFHYVVTPAMVGVPQNFTLGYREGGVTIDLILFSTHTNLMDAYAEAQLDNLLTLPKLAISSAGTNAVLSWLTDTGFILESSSSLVSPSWSPVMDPAVTVGNRYTHTVAATGGQKFYRLRQP